MAWMRGRVFDTSLLAAAFPRIGVWLCVLLWLWLAGCQSTVFTNDSGEIDSRQSAVDHSLSETAAPAGQENAASSGASRGFRSERAFREHFEKHGGQFGDITPGEYLRLARQLRDSETGPTILEVVRADRTVTRFDTDRGHFGAYNSDGSIRTFFIPNDGIRYFQRQAERK